MGTVPNRPSWLHRSPLGDFLFQPDKENVANGDAQWEEAPQPCFSPGELKADANDIAGSAVKALPHSLGTFSAKRITGTEHGTPDSEAPAVKT